MSTAELKSYLHQLIVETNDTTILKKVREYFKSLQKEKEIDWWNTISAQEKKAIQKGVKQPKEGNGIAHKEVRKKVDQLLSKK